MIAGKYTSRWALALAERYCRQIESGERPVCRHERYGVQRYRHDLERAAERGWYFDKKQAAFAIRFLPLMLKHHIGEYYGEPFEPSPYQAWILANIFGWRDASTKLRRFRRAYVTVARKNGKTHFGAAVCALCAYADSPTEYGGQAFLAATKKGQAELTFAPLVEFVEGNPDLAEHATRYKAPPRLVVEVGPMKYEIRLVGSDSKRQDGLNPSFVLKDEVHEWGETLRDLHEKLSTGGASRRHPLELITTTAAGSEAPIWEEVHADAEEVLEAAGRGDYGYNDRLFAYVAQTEKEDDILDPATWPKSNPNLGISVRAEYLQQQCDEARHNPAQLAQVQRYHGNRRTASFAQAYPDHVWGRGNQDWEDPPADGDLVFGGMDLGRTEDWAAVTFVFPRYDSQAEHWTYRWVSRSWCCQASTKLPFTRPPFNGWIAEGLLEYQAAEVLDFGPIRSYVLEFHERYALRQMNYDQRFAQELAADLLNNHGVEMANWWQSPRNYTGPILSLSRALKHGRIYHRGCPLLAWQARNAELVPKPDGLLMLDKGQGKRFRKIDAIAAGLMAYDGALVHCEQEDGITFNTSGDD